MCLFQKNADNLKVNLRIKGDLLFFSEKYQKNIWNVHLSSAERQWCLRLK